MFFIVYKTTCIINGKIYIGKHQTRNLNDGYIGSGKSLKYAVRKYGIDNFVASVVAIYDFAWQMNLAERILVVPDKETNYNLAAGGRGGFAFLNMRGLRNSKAQRSIARNLMIAINLKRGADGNRQLMAKARALAPVPSPDHMKRMREAAGRPEAARKRQATYTEIKHSVGWRNSQHGTQWITDGKSSRKIRKIEPIPAGWAAGRKVAALRGGVA